MVNQRARDFKDFVGKTIVEVDDAFSNAVTFKFSDGQEITVMAECGSGQFDIPYLEILD